MNREIKFRGKRLDNGEWVYGGFVKVEEKYFIVQSSTKEILIFGSPHIHWDDLVPVNPKTVGQFTGLKDKNGKEIYEDDVVSAWSEGYNHKGKIKWRLEGMPCIIIYPAFANQGFWKIHGSLNIHDGSYYDDGVEVIDNIHDNPELIS